MSVYKESIQAFIEIIESGLISTADWADLSQRANNFLEDDEEICEEIDQWLQLESRSQIREAYIQKLEAIAASSPIENDNSIGIAKSKSTTPSNQPSPSSKEQVVNAIQRNSPPPDSDTTPSEPKN
ncbi:MAG: hypothetical protein F6K36_16440 [Symploca sp. SIO3C6]|nr:hypothetical protein [Symploca sp. SIO3C6]